ncbi:MAG: DAK2 domain-containing protein [Clostridiales bacterium]|nr:DAK2 domain-containing protein [Clostridiales bacterium]
MREYISGAEFRDMLLCASAALEADKQKINELNVFPVPDGDTGTNMSLTLSSAAKELRKKAPKTLTEVADITASALLRGARGNSGVILSLLFRGISKRLKGLDQATAAQFAAAMNEGVEAAYKAVMKPAEGTVLTVSRLAAAAAVEFSATGSDIGLMLVCAHEAAKAALAETIHINPVLTRAGVVDAGGYGYCTILGAMLASFQGTFVAPEAAPEATAQPASEGADFSSFDNEEITYGYCTEFIAARETGKAPELLRAFLESIGDCVVVVDDDDIIKVHVHTDEPGRVLTEALTYGQLLTIKVENMRQQHTKLADSEPKERIAPPENNYGYVAVCAGDGMKELFRELGCDRVVTGGQTMNPSTQDILKEVLQTPAKTVFVFPNNKNIIMAAEQCIPLCTDRKIVVIPTKTVPQGVTAMLSANPDATEEELTRAFTEAIDTVHTAQITYAARDSEFDGLTIHAGEYLALLDGALLGSDSELSVLLDRLSEAFRPFDPAVVTVYYGCDVQEDQARSTLDALAASLPEAETNLIDGGQPVYYYMIAAE